jgi:hypothetical protein
MLRVEVDSSQPEAQVTIIANKPDRVIALQAQVDEILKDLQQAQPLAQTDWALQKASCSAKSQQWACQASGPEQRGMTLAQQ